MVKIPFMKTIKNYIDLHKNHHLRNWNLSTNRAMMLVHDYAEWQRYYLPISIKGKIVLDAGAGEGESAAFFLHHEARRIIAIECDPRCLPNLYANATNYPITVIPTKFDIKHLSIPHDFCKIDIEGWEELLLPLEPSTLKPTVIEIHGQQLAEHFISRGWRYLKQTELQGCISYVANIPCVQRQTS